MLFRKKVKLRSDKDVVETLKEIGWRCKRDEVGDYYCSLNLGDRQISVIPTVQEGFDGRRLSFIESVSTKAFTAAVVYIFNEKSDHTPLIRPKDCKASPNTHTLTEADVRATIKKAAQRTLQRSKEVEEARKKGRHKVKELTKNDVVAAVQRVLDWASVQDIELALKHYRENLPDRPGQKQLYHLAALALGGDVETLTSYRQSFARGDRLNFVPMITDEVIDRSIEFAVLSEVSAN